MNESGEALVKDKSALNFEKALLETESLRLDFQVDAKWQISHIRSNPNIKTEPQRLDL